MGNTPEPCDTCKHLYADCMNYDNPNYNAECKHGWRMGNPNCPWFQHWEDTVKKEFKDLSRGSYFKIAGIVYIKIEQVDDRTGDIACNAVCLSREAQGVLAYIISTDEVTLLPNMKH